MQLAHVRPRGSIIYTTIRELGPKIPDFRRNYGSQFPNACICGPSGRVVSTQLFMREALCMIMSLQCTRPELQNISHMEGIRVAVVRALVLEEEAARMLRRIRAVETLPAQVHGTNKFKIARKFLEAGRSLVRQAARNLLEVLGPRILSRMLLACRLTVFKSVNA